MKEILELLNTWKDLTWHDDTATTEECDKALQAYIDACKEHFGDKWDDVLTMIGNVDAEMLEGMSRLNLIVW
ncbi:MAG: hypothetical protein ACR2PH_17920 [Desulfobulbia bacterium]